jgi:hypothetical protein
LKQTFGLARVWACLLSIIEPAAMAKRQALLSTARPDALSFEAPKLAVTAVTPLNEDFAARLDRAIARSEKVKLIDRGPQKSIFGLPTRSDFRAS